jgi:ATP-dependent DNA helicase RecQ
VVAPAGTPSPFLAELAGETPVIRLREEPAAATPSRSPKKKATAKAEPAGPPGELEQALRSWRTAQARQEGRAPFVILHDSTLREIASRRPASLIQLGAVPGIGPAKLERYGDDILGSRTIGPVAPPSTVQRRRGGAPTSIGSRQNDGSGSRRPCRCQMVAVVARITR